MEEAFGRSMSFKECLVGSTGRKHNWRMVQEDKDIVLIKWDVQKDWIDEVSSICFSKRLMEIDSEYFLAKFKSEIDFTKFSTTQPYPLQVATWIRLLGLLGSMYKKTLLQEIFGMIEKNGKEANMSSKPMEDRVEKEHFGPWMVVTRLQHRPDKWKVALMENVLYTRPQWGPRLLVDLDPNPHGIKDQVGLSRVLMELVRLGKVIAIQVTKLVEEGNAVGSRTILPSESTHMVALELNKSMIKNGLRTMETPNVTIEADGRMPAC
ncbi:hypothetical protein Goklo_004731 [Gossypium klotzschianum]|uniref:DUF4283 domain-containing protein n=1 Tax=Gossypium klotzschianum TaxID=34286 RepID=A0A7J8VQ94_9ROSI|nr:hypothetical protein [Gossypium klotzschianum]